MAAETQKTKDLTNKDNSVTKLIEWATVNADSIEDMEALFSESGVSYSSGEELGGEYRLVTGDEKQAFLNRISGAPLFVVKWEFRVPDSGNKEYVSAHILVQGFGKFVINDGSKTGLYGQLSELTARRIAQGIDDSHAKAGLKAGRGFKKGAEYWYNTATNKAIPKGEMDDFEKHPKNKREKGHPIWKLEF